MSAKGGNGKKPASPAVNLIGIVTYLHTVSFGANYEQLVVAPV